MLPSPDKRIFLYVRLLGAEGEVARTKIRELAGLDYAIADLAGELMAAGAGPIPRREVRIEYVCATTDRPLLTLVADWERGEQVISGFIPDHYRERMLDDPPRVDPDRFCERLGKKLDPEYAQKIGDWMRTPRVSILALIRGAITSDGSFEIRLPLDPKGFLDSEPRPPKS